MLNQRIPGKLSAMLGAATNAETSRRNFLLGAAAAGSALVIGFRPATPALASDADEDEAINPLSAYVTIDADNTITVHSAHFDMGQGAYHGIATLVKEELGCSWDQMSVIGAAGNVKAYGNVVWGGFAQGTGGSTAMASSWDRYRRAGATAREMLKAAAADDWGVAVSDVSVEDGMLKGPAGQEATYGAMAEKAAALPLPAEVELKPASAWTEIGNEQTLRHDRVAKTNGTQDFTIDVKLPGLLTAVPIHPPKFGAKVASFDASEAKAVKGMVDVVETPRGLAVVAEHMWAAIKGRELVTVDWDESEAETRGSETILSEYRSKSGQTPTVFARNDGDAETALADADQVIEATYEFPFLAHAALEPLNAVAHRNDDGIIEVWGGHQIPDMYQMASAQVAGVDPSQVKMHVMKSGGGFGRRAVADADVIVEAVAAAKALGWRAPVRMQWTREDDMRAGRYRPAYVHRLRAGLDADGNIIAWDNHIVGQSIVAGTPFEGMAQNGVDPTSVEGSSTLPYGIANLSVGLTTTDVKVPVLWWRAVGSTHTAYATEAFFDELATASGKDPVAWRLEMLKEHPRHARTLELVAEKANWGGPVPEGRARGVVLHESFSSVVAQIAEVSVDGTDVRVHKVWCAVDCGTAINPDTIKAQMEGGIGFGLGSILTEELNIAEGGVVDEGNYDSYAVLRMDQMPEIEVHIVPSDSPPTGVGEPGTPPIGPAVANAVFAATGKRIYRLPFAKGFV
jgi:isoquinoline 1-oxidoreductase beta subunit